MGDTVRKQSDILKPIELRIEEIQDSEDDDEWVQLGWINREDNSAATSDNNGMDSDCDDQVCTCLSKNELCEISQTQTMIDNNEAEQRAHSEESDSVSVITESEVESNILNKKFNQIDYYKGKIHNSVKMMQEEAKHSLQNNVTYNIVIVCILGILLGLIVCRISFVTDVCSLNDDINYETIKTQSDNLINNIKDLTEVKSVLDQIKANLPSVATDVRYQKKRNLNKHSKKWIEALNIESFDSTSTILKQLQMSINAFGSTMNYIDNTNESFKTEINKSQNIIADLNVFQSIMKNTVEQIQHLDKPMEARFLQGANDKIRHVTQSLLSDLLETVYELAININSKFSKIKYKLNKKMCAIRNSLPDGTYFLKQLDENNSLLDSCDNTDNINTSEKFNNKQTIKERNKKNKYIKEKYMKKTQPPHAKGDITSDSDAKSVHKKSLHKQNNKQISKNNWKGAEVMNRKQTKHTIKTFDSVISQFEFVQNTCPLQQVYPFYSRDVPGSSNETYMNGKSKQQNVNGWKKNVDEMSSVRKASKSYININDNKLYQMVTPNKKDHLNFEQVQNTGSDVPNLNQKVPNNAFSSDNMKIQKSSKRKKNRSNEFQEDFTKRKTRKKESDENQLQKISKCQQKGSSRRKVSDADWQFERSRSRAEHHNSWSQSQDSKDASNWYFTRAHSRENARSL